MRASVTAMNDVLTALETVPIFFSSFSKFHDLSVVRSKAVETMLRGLFESIWCENAIASRCSSSLRSQRRIRAYTSVS